MFGKMGEELFICRLLTEKCVLGKKVGLVQLSGTTKVPFQRCYPDSAPCSQFSLLGFPPEAFLE